MRGWSMFWESLQMSVTNILSNKLRSFLTMLGIVIGVAAVIALITIVSGVTASVMESFSSLGAGTMSVSIYEDGTNVQGLGDRQLEEIRALDGVASVSPGNTMSTTAVVNRKAYTNVTLVGQDASYIQRADLVAAGRAFTTAESSGNSRVCLVGDTFLQKTKMGSHAIGQKIMLNGAVYQIIGVEKKNNDMSGQYVDEYGTSGTVFVPYKDIMKMSLKNTVAQFNVYKTEEASSADVESELRSYLEEYYNKRKDVYYIQNMDSISKEMEASERQLSMMLGGIASIALLVGGIGIMNMMLTSVSERTREIGLKKALGAEPRLIQLQFLMESVTLSVMGGLIGTVLGVGIAYIGSVLLKTAFRVPLRAIALGIGFSAGVGIVFGWLPARRASRLNPIDALRSE